MRKIRNAYFSLYLTFDGLDTVISNHVQSPQVRRLGLLKQEPRLDRRSSMSSSAVDQLEPEKSLVDAFSELGQQHLAFVEKDAINEDMKKRKKSDAAISFVAERTSYTNPNHKPRGRKPGSAYSSSSQPTGESSSRQPSDRRAQKPPGHYKDMVSTKSSRHSRKTKVQETKEEKEDELKETKEDEPDKDDDKEPDDEWEAREARLSGREDVSKRETSNNDEIFTSDEEDLIVRCNEKGLKDLARAVHQRLPDITAACEKRQEKDASVIDMHLEVVISEILELANVCQESLPLKAASGKCFKCSNKTQLRACPRFECKQNSLIFCPDHLAHCKRSKHNVVGAEVNEK